MLRLTFLLFVCFASAFGSTEEEVYVQSLAANIEKSGLLTNFAQSWKQHVEVWERMNHRASNVTFANGTTVPTNGSWPNNGTWPTPANFNCDRTPPTDETEHTINRLHPSHIGIVAAMGASMVAGTGADATQLFETAIQYRGLSFPIGGDGSLNDTLTVPNILREYNSRVRGSSHGVAPAWFEEGSGLNVAVPGATASDLDDQAKELIKRINALPGAMNEWKLVTIFIGMNDLCEACDKRVSGRASSYGRRIKSALDKLEKGLNKTLVSVIALPPMHQWYSQLHEDQVCHAVHQYVCPCISNAQTDTIAEEYNAELYKLPERYTRVDFAVVIQPFMSGAVQWPKVNVSGAAKADLSFFAPDCFHLSRRGHAAAARSLWTNLFQAVGQKRRTMDLGEGDLSCPDKNCPFIRNGRNTYDCRNVWPRTHDEWNHTHHVNVTVVNTSVYHYKPWHHNVISLVKVPAQSVSSYSSSDGGWIAFAVVLALAVVATATVGYLDLKRRQGRERRMGEHTPLLTGSNVEQIY